MGDTSEESNANDDELYSYAGCYDNTLNKLLSDGPHRGNTMSAEICYNVCTKRPFRNNLNYFGTQKKDTCFCGKVVDIEANNLSGYKRNTSECSSNCKGRDDEKCGSKFNVSLYKLKGNHGNETTTTTNGLPTNTTNNVTLAGNHGNETTTTTNGLPTNTTNNVTLAATIPIILVTALAFLLIAAVLVSIAVCHRRKKREIRNLLRSSKIKLKLKSKILQYIPK